MLILEKELTFIKNLIIEIRVEQWVKNILIFSPIFVGNYTLNQDSHILLIYFFLALSSLASSTYIINDLLDIKADQLHPQKKFRPIAASIISPFIGKIVSLALFCLTALFTYYLGQKAAILLCLYFVITIAYSYKLKEIFLVDIFILGFLYLIRAASGFYLLGIQAPILFLITSFIFFFGLALVKRIVEIQLYTGESVKNIQRRGYTTQDYQLLIKIFYVLTLILILILFYSMMFNKILNLKYNFFILFLASFWQLRLLILVIQKRIRGFLLRAIFKDKILLSLFVFIAIIGVSNSFL